MKDAVLIRPGLLKLWTDGKKMTFISAPPGYGKTLNTRLWIERAGIAAAFVSLDETHNDSFAFYRALGSVLESRPRSADSPDLPWAINQALDRVSDREAIVLDDFHLIRDERTIKSVAFLTERLPAGCRMFILSRTEPPLQFESFRLKGQMSRVDADDLRFDAAGIGRLAKLCGQSLSAEEINRARALTDGWPAAARAWLSGQSTADGRRRVFQFFEDELWKNSGNTVKKNILLACVADVLNPSLFTALTDEPRAESFLADMCRENAFFSQVHGDCYRFHCLFREFLMEKLLAAGFLPEEQYLKAAKWYESREMPYMAVKYYLSAGAGGETAASLRAAFSRMEKNGSVEARYAQIKQLSLSSCPDAVLRENILLLKTRALGYYLGGEPALLSRDMDLLKELPADTNDEETRAAAALFRALDQRETLSEIVDSLYHSGQRFAPALTARAASLSQNLPLFHRSCRDHSEYAEDMEEKLRKTRETLGRLVGREYETIENCIRAGIFYEKGMLEKAHFFASKAVGEVCDDMPSETAFCAYMMLASVLYAMNRTAAADEIVAGVHANIVQRESEYLLPNLRAFVARRKLREGDIRAARDWLRNARPDPTDENLLFYEIYLHFTTAKAYVVSGMLEPAISLTGRLLSLCEAYNRPLDIIEALLLLSIALRKKKRAREADKALVRAVEIAQRYGFTQLFAAESAELSAELGRLSHRLSQPTFKDRLDAVFVKALYFAAIRSSRQERNLPGMERPRLSKRQSELIHLLAEGCSYQEISEKTGIKMSTIKTYLRVAYQKLGAVNKREAVAKATALGIVGEAR